MFEKRDEMKYFLILFSFPLPFLALIDSVDLHFISLSHLIFVSIYYLSEMKTNETNRESKAKRQKNVFIEDKNI